MTSTNDPQTVGAALTAASMRFGDREAYTFADRRLSFRDADVESDEVARAFLGFGVGRGDRVAIWMAGHSPWVPLYFGLLKIGAVLVPLNTRMRPDEIEYGLTKAGATMLFFKREVKGRTDYGDVLLEVLPELRDARSGALHARRVPKLHTVVDLAASPMNGTLGFGEFLERGTAISTQDLAAVKHAVQPRDEALLQYTSGTTALPKAARLYHAGVLHGGRYAAMWGGMTERDVYFTLQPFYHSGGSIGAILPPIVSGCRMVTQPYFEPGEALDAIESERATIMAGHQPHFVEYLNHPTLAQRRFALERAFVVAPPELFWMVREKFGLDGLLSSYGMTETHLAGTCTMLSDPMEVRFNTNGPPNPGVEVQIRDPDDGTLLGPEEAGEYFVRAPYPMLGYLDEPGLTADVLDADGWYRSGDNGFLRKDGNLCLLGRVRDMIRVGGENLAGAEVEAVLLAHPAVKQAAAVAAPEPRLGEVVVAFIELKSDSRATASELIEHCRAKLANYKVPRTIHFVTSWPMTGSGKVQKRLLLDSLT